jgi:hypothetical protein
MTELPGRDWQLYPPLPEDIGGIEIGILGEDEPISYQAIIETICGAADDSQPVEQYDGSLGARRT